jgi:uncharacterized C2H2 Zn-finger protein
MQRNLTTLSGLVALKKDLEEQLKALNDGLSKLREENARERRIWRLACQDEGVEFGTPHDEYPVHLRKKHVAIRNRYRMKAEPLEKEAEKLIQRYVKTVREINKLPIGTRPRSKKNLLEPRIEWSVTLDELADKACLLALNGEYRSKTEACKAMVKKYTYKGKRINEGSLYKYMKGKKMGTEGG